MIHHPLPHHFKFIHVCLCRHRINTSEFKPLDILANKFVLQVACGQQHSICRAVPRDSPLLQDGEVGVGSDCGADAYVWGNGTLGQLGLGKCAHEWALFG
jgi:alpha-tubulin suppressor-like RCC1 family protein